MRPSARKPKRGAGFHDRILASDMPALPAELFELVRVVIRDLRSVAVQACEDLAAVCWRHNHPGAAYHVGRMAHRIKDAG
ncbi:MAG: hypothetical protein JXR96_04865 [Deltaproteobacteria bacterium]|nr:hypothetical protein [Deltaproteobacteria bacterium]